MLIAINTKNEYGKQGTVGINLMPELNDDGSTTYAHSMEQAKTWVKGHQAFKNVEMDSLYDGRFIASSEWKPKDTALDILFGSNGATHERQTVVLCPVNTVYETIGHK